MNVYLGLYKQKLFPDSSKENKGVKGFSKFPVLLTSPGDRYRAEEGEKLIEKKATVLL